MTLKTRKSRLWALALIFMAAFVLIAFSIDGIWASVTLLAIFAVILFAGWVGVKLIAWMERGKP